jgi:hypothetical protein
MRCTLCENLEQAFQTRQNEYFESATLACYHVSRKFAAYKMVEMERARLEFQEHQAVCVVAANLTGHLPAGTLLRPAPQENHRAARVGAAA